MVQRHEKFMQGNIVFTAGSELVVIKLGESIHSAIEAAVAASRYFTLRIERFVVRLEDWKR